MDQQKTGQFLKMLRSQKSITQAELAEVLGVSNRSISRWENGTMSRALRDGYEKWYSRYAGLTGA